MAVPASAIVRRGAARGRTAPAAPLDRSRAVGARRADARCPRLGPGRRPGHRRGFLPQRSPADLRGGRRARSNATNPAMRSRFPGTWRARACSTRWAASPTWARSRATRRPPRTSAPMRTSSANARCCGSSSRPATSSSAARSSPRGARRARSSTTRNARCSRSPSADRAARSGFVHRQEHAAARSSTGSTSSTIPTAR